MSALDLRKQQCNV